MADPKWLPTHRGFDEYLGILYSNDMRPVQLMDGTNVAEYPLVQATLTRRYTDRSLSFIERNKARPFFLYFATHNIHVPRVPHPRFKGSSPVGTRGDSIHELDDTAGKLLAKLDELKLTDNTLLIFTSDNGGVMDDGYEDVGRFDYHPNQPLRGYKGSIWEGGHRVPFLARWPGKIPAGGECQVPAMTIDVLPTVAKLVGAELRGKTSQVTVRFVSQLVSVTRDAQGNVTDGNPDKVTDVTDIWTFARDITSRDPNWKLVATEAPA